MARKRKMSALQRRYFGPRARRSVRAKVRRSYTVVRRSVRRRRSFVRGWLPLSGREHVSAAATGALTPLAMSYVNPVLDPITKPFLGGYSDEFNTYVTGAFVHKIAPGIGKDIGKDMARLAVMSASGQAITPFLQGMFGNGTTAGNGGYL